MRVSVRVCVCVCVCVSVLGHSDCCLNAVLTNSYYYNDAAHPSANYSGHFPYDYKEVDK